jgi:hypothetical protein
MPYYMVWNPDDPAGEAYWVLAASPEEARQIIATTPKLRVPDATDASKFECEPDDQKQPGPGLICRALYGPVAFGEK